MSRYRLLSMLMFLVVSPAGLAAQDQRLTERLDPATAMGVQSLVDSARAASLPSEPLIQKALEGSTMGATPDRIRVAVDALFEQLVHARAALGRDATEAELTAGAGALRAGLAAVSLRQLHELRSNTSLAVPIAVLTDLVAEGVTPDQANRGGARAGPQRALGRRFRGAAKACAGRAPEERAGRRRPALPSRAPTGPRPSGRAMRSACMLGLIAWLSTSATTPAAAQLAGRLDVGAGSNHPDGSIPGAVASFAPALTFGAGPLRLAGDGVYSDAAGGRWNFQGTSAAAFRSPVLGIFRAELLAQADWTWH